MEKQNEGGLPTQAKAEQVMEDKGPLTVAQLAAEWAKQGAEETVPAETTEATSDEQPAAAEEAKAEPAVAEEGGEAKGDEQPAEQPESEDEEVLSQLTPKTLEKFQKRTDQLTARAKTAEEKAAALEAKVKELETKAATPPEPQQQEPVPVIAVTDDPSDLTGTAKSDADLDKLERDARHVLSTYDKYEDDITHAIANRLETVTVDGEEVKVATLRSMKKSAEKHLAEKIPARRQYIKARTEAVNVAKKEFPVLFDARSQEYQDLQWARRTYPALNTIPNLEVMMGFMLEGIAARKAKQEAAKAAPVKPAAAVPPKAAADTGTAPAAKAKAGTDNGRMKADLVKAEEAFNKSGSKADWEKLETLKFQSRLKK